MSTNNIPEDWYYMEGDNPVGPFPLAVIKQLLNAGTISPDTLASCGINGDRQPLSELNLNKATNTPTRASTDTWQVNLGNILTRNSKTGLIRNGTISIVEGRVAISGWKLWQSGRRLSICAVLTAGAVWTNYQFIQYLLQNEKEGGWMLHTGKAIDSFLKNSQAPNWVEVTIMLVFGLAPLWLILIAIILPLFLLYLAKRAETQLIPASIPERNGQKIRIRLRHPRDKRSGVSFIKFRSPQEAESFASQIVPVPDQESAGSAPAMSESDQWEINLNRMGTKTGFTGKAVIGVSGNHLVIQGRKLLPWYYRVAAGVCLLLIGSLLHVGLGILLAVLIPNFLMWTRGSTVFDPVSKPHRTISKVTMPLRPEGTASPRSCKIPFYNSGDAKDFTSRFQPRESRN